MLRSHSLPTPTNPDAQLFDQIDARRRSLIDYRAELNDEQRAVVFAEAGPVLVIAGAGSGKTRTVTYRVARLLEAGVAPTRIMLVTFTNRAAREMLQRVESLVKADVRRLVGGTFHSIGNRMLRRHATSLGYGSNFTILDAEDATHLIDLCIDDAAIDTRARRFPKGAGTARHLQLRDQHRYAAGAGDCWKYPQFELLTSPDRSS
jgi:DNA helicase-2/ATP-dependent DNA helicase PcrA